jgi:hypothetical protein
VLVVVVHKSLRHSYTHYGEEFRLECLGSWLEKGKRAKCSPFTVLQASLENDQANPLDSPVETAFPVEVEGWVVHRKEA